MTNKYLEKIAGTFIEAATLGGAAGAAAAPKGHRGSGVLPGIGGGLGGSVVGAALGSRFGRRGLQAGIYGGAAAGGALLGHNSGMKAKKKHDERVELENYRKMHGQK